MLSVAWLAQLKAPAISGFAAALTPFDWFVVALAVWSTLRGLVRGLIRELFGLAALLIGLTVASWNYPGVSLRLERWVSSPTYAGFLAFLLLAVAVAAGVVLLGRLTRSAAHLVGLGLLDRLGGALFGCLRASLFGAAILMSCIAFLPPQPWLLHSRLAPYLLQLAHALSFLAPVELQQRIVVTLQQIRHVLPASP